VPLYNLTTAELEKIRTEVQAIHNLIERAYKVQFEVQPPPSNKSKLRVSLTNPDGTAASGREALCPTNVAPGAPSGERK